MKIFDDDEWFIQGESIWRASPTKHPVDGWGSSISCGRNSKTGKSQCLLDLSGVLWQVCDISPFSKKFAFLESSFAENETSKVKEVLSRYDGPEPQQISGKELNAFINELQNAMSG